MKKTYKIEVDCANCANKMEEAARGTAGVQAATVNFMTQKLIVEFAEGQEPKAVMDAGPSFAAVIQHTFLCCFLRRENHLR